MVSDGGSPALDGASAPDRERDVRHSAGGVVNGAVLFADALLRNSRRSFGPASGLVCRGSGSLPAGDGQQGGNGVRPNHGAALRSGVHFEILRGDLSQALGFLCWFGSHLVDWWRLVDQ